MREYQQTTMVDILTRSPALAQIVYKVDQLAKLNRIILKKLDPELAPYCRVANCREGILILTTTSPAYGHLLRFSTSDLLSSLRADPAFYHLKSIKTQIRPSLPASMPIQKSLAGPHLSPIGAQTLQKLASEIESLKLKKSLLRLSTRTTAGGNLSRSSGI